MFHNGRKYINVFEIDTLLFLKMDEGQPKTYFFILYHNQQLIRIIFKIGLVKKHLCYFVVNHKTTQVFYMLNKPYLAPSNNSSLQTTSVVYRLLPSLSSHVRVVSFPSKAISFPLATKFQLQEGGIEILGGDALKIRELFIKFQKYLFKTA